MYEIDAQRQALKDIRAMTDFGAGVRVAVLDGAVDPDHPDLAGHGFDLISESQRTLHGTAVATLIAGRERGIAPKADLFQVPVFQEDFAGHLQGCSQLVLAQAIKRAVRDGASIINISGAHLSNTGHPVDEMREAIELCIEKNVIVVAAVGNDGLTSDTIPAAMRDVLAIGAHDIEGQPAEFNNNGPSLVHKMLLAPGVDIRLPQRDAEAKLSGSSFAAPVVSGVCALIRALVPKASIGDVHNALQKSCVPVPSSHAGDTGSAAPARRLDFVLLHEHLQPLGARAVTPSTCISKRTFPMSDTEQPMDLVAPAGDVALADGGADIAPAQADAPASAQPAPASAPAPAAEVAPAAAPLENFASSGPPLRPARPAIQDPAANTYLHDPTPQMVKPQSVGSNLMADDKVFVSGVIGYDFVTETNIDYFHQAMGDMVQAQPHLGPLLPSHPVHMARFLSYRLENGFQPNMDKSTALVWTLKIDNIPIYAIRPQNQFAAMEFARLVQYMIEQTGIDPSKFADPNAETTSMMAEASDAVDCPDKVDRVSIAGQIIGETRLYNGHVVPTVAPILRGMFSWNPSALAKHALGDKPKAAETEGLRNFLERVYYEIRNKGSEPYDRAINYAATNAYNAGEVFRDAVSKNLELNAINVERSPVGRPGSDFWDVIFEFFNPQRREEEARMLYRYTVDVSGLMPVTFGEVRSWRAY